MPQLHGLIFDLDGTLVDSAPDLRQAINAVLKSAGRRPLTLDEVKAKVGDGMMPLMTRAFEATGGQPANFNAYNCFQDFVAQYRSLKADPSQIFPYVRELLEKYRTSGVKIGICTNKQEASTLRLLNDLDLMRYFDFVAGGDTFPTHKPHPDHVKGVMEKLDVVPPNAVMIGDGPNDIRAAQGAGIPCIAVAYGYGSDFAEYGADKIVADFRELPEALASLGFEVV
ncbi:MAG: HAD family hydrolase [Bdellovibrionales bacterium]